MRKQWRQKLWIEFDRDNDIKTIHINTLDNDQTDAFKDIQELKIENRNGSHQYLQEFLDHIKFSTGKVHLKKVEIVKVFFTQDKARILSEALSHPNCRIEELIFDRCRAKSEKMGMIFGALAHNHSVASLTLQNMNIPRASLVAMVDMFDTNRALEMLTMFNTGLTDTSIKTLASGLKQAHGLVYLDLRQNTFEEEGLKDLINSITGHSSLQTLRLNSITLKKEELNSLKQLFSNPKCHIQDLELEELEVSDSGSQDLIEAIMTLKHLFTFDFSNNTLPAQMVSSIVRMIAKYQEIEILCFNHVEMNDEICRLIFHGMTNSNLIFLNLSWNLLSENALECLVPILSVNRTLEKLALQHNNLGKGNLKSFANAISEHQSLKYIDISQNRLKSRDFIKIFLAIQSPHSRLETLHCRKNLVGGPKVDNVLLCKSKYLKVLNLCNNKLTEQNAIALLQYSKENCCVEKLLINKNVMVSAQIVKDIAEECEMNILIKEKILKDLKQAVAHGVQNLIHHRDSFYGDYDVSEVVLADQKLDSVLFISKFIRQNYQHCLKLSLIRIDEVEYIQDKITSAFTYVSTGSFLSNLRSLHLEDTQISSRGLRRLLNNVKQGMPELKELYLINIDALEGVMNVLADALKKHKKVKILNIRQTNMRTRDVSSLVPLLSVNKVISDLDISKAIISRNNMQHLWVALHMNISVTKLNYSRINFFCLSEIRAIDAELHMNTIIRDQIIPKVKERRKIDPEQAEDTLNFRGIEFPHQSYPAIIKYIKTQRKVKDLNLSATGLRSSDVKQFIIELAKRQLQLTSLNLSENQAVNDRVLHELSFLFTNSSTLIHLHLDETNITVVGIKTILESVKSSLKVRTISVQKCGLKFNQEDETAILELLKLNISLTDFRLTKNVCSLEFLNAVLTELQMNDLIVKHIFPQMVNQEIEARNAALEARKKQRRDGQLFNKQRKEKLQEMAAKRASSQASSRQQIDLAALKQLGREDTPEPAFKGKAFLGSRNDFIPENTPEPNQTHQNHHRLPTMSHQPRQKTPTIMVTDQDASEGDSDRKEVLQTPQSVSSQSEDESKLDSEDDENLNDVPQNLQGSGAFNISFKDLNLSDMSFMTKFMRIFPKIKSIDFGENKLQQDEMEEFGEQLKLNKYIQNIEMKKHGSNKLAGQLKDELDKNKAINEVKEALAYDTNAKELDLKNVDMKDMAFLPKMIQQFNCLETLDLSNSNLQSKSSVQQVCQMIDENDTIKNLILRNCKLTGNNLLLLAGALTQSNNEHLIKLDIRENLSIQDAQYKVLFGLLQQNTFILEIQYDLVDEENLESLKLFRELHEQGKKAIDIPKIIHQMKHAHHHHGIPLWQKIIFPIWIWKAFIHDKHEAFRFKYDTVSIQKLENVFMPTVKWHLYAWTVVYYIIMLVLPPLAIGDLCGQTFDPWLYAAFGGYIALVAIWEVWVVLRIQKLVGKANILKFNKWHAVELVMGSVARTDTFIDILFIHLVGHCPEDFQTWIYPTVIFAVVNLTGTLSMLFRLCKTDFGNKLYQPVLESTCFASFIRENMLLATVLDSFCINNCFYMFDKPLVFGKLMGFISFFTQDLPQLTTHVLFKLVIFNEAQTKLKTQTLLTVGMIFSVLANCVSIFNMVMCQQNEFDPIVLECELYLRRETVEEKKKLQEEQERRQQMVKQASSLRNKFTSKLTLMLSQKSQDSAQTFDIDLAGRKNRLHSEKAKQIPGLEDSEPQNRFTMMQKLRKQFDDQKNSAGGGNQELNSYLGYLEEGTNELNGKNQNLRAEDKKIIKDELDSNRTSDYDTSKPLIATAQITPDINIRLKSKTKVHFAEEQQLYSKNPIQQAKTMHQLDGEGSGKFVYQEDSHSISQVEPSPEKSLKKSEPSHQKSPAKKSSRNAKLNQVGLIQLQKKDANVPSPSQIPIIKVSDADDFPVVMQEGSGLQNDSQIALIYDDAMRDYDDYPVKVGMQQKNKLLQFEGESKTPPRISSTKTDQKTPSLIEQDFDEYDAHATKKQSHSPLYSENVQKYNRGKKARTLKNLAQNDLEEVANSPKGGSHAKDIESHIYNLISDVGEAHVAPVQQQSVLRFAGPARRSTESYSDAVDYEAQSME